MKMIFKFRMLSDENEDFVRDYEVPVDMTLLEFHDYINEDLKYDKSMLASFFKSDVDWEKLQEFTLLDMGTEGVDIDPYDDIPPPVPMSEVKLGVIITQSFDRLIYVFDLMTERSFYIELLESKIAENGISYPHKIASEGEAPKQLMAFSIDDIAELVQDKLDDLTGDESSDNE